jgi:hypothetical protein
MDLELLTNILNLYLDKIKMKKSNTKLFFEKTTVIELNDNSLQGIKGGTLTASIGPISVIVSIATLSSVPTSTIYNDSDQLQ